MYSIFPSLVKNIRRGNTIVQVDKEYFMARKGLMKFFDMRLAFISKDERCFLDIKKYKEDLH